MLEKYSLSDLQVMISSQGIYLEGNTPFKKIQI